MNKRKILTLLINLIIVFLGYFELFNKYYGKVDNKVFIKAITFFIITGILMGVLGVIIISIKKKLSDKQMIFYIAVCGTIMPGYLGCLAFLENKGIDLRVIYLTVIGIFLLKNWNSVKEVLTKGIDTIKLMHKEKI